jgi:hypothetical protein
LASNFEAQRGTESNTFAGAQVMHHPWSRKLDRDVVFAHPQTGQHMAVPCWTLCLREHDKAIRDAHARSDDARRAAAGGHDFFPHGWSLPHLKFEDVATMLTGVHQMRPPYAPRGTKGGPCGGDDGCEQSASTSSSAMKSSDEREIAPEELAPELVPEVAAAAGQTGASTDGSEKLVGHGMEAVDAPEAQMQPIEAG